MERILLLEDDLSLIEGLSYALRKQGWDVTAARTVMEGKQLCRENDFDLFILDVSLPDGNGFDFCGSVRQISDAPILFLSASDEETSIIRGLDIGGDDYVTKPFKLAILISRVNALLRRGRGKNEAAGRLESCGILVVTDQGQVYKENRRIELTSAEYRLLCYFLTNPNRILTKRQIYEQLWDNNGCFVDDNTLSVYIRRLRLKIEDDPEHPEKIVTVRGMGYKWNASI